MLERSLKQRALDVVWFLGCVGVAICLVPFAWLCRDADEMTESNEEDEDEQG